MFLRPSSSRRRTATADASSSTGSQSPRASRAISSTSENAVAREQKPSKVITRDVRHAVNANGRMDEGWFAYGVPMLKGLFPSEYDDERNVYFPPGDFLQLLHARTFAMPSRPLHRPPGKTNDPISCRTWVNRAPLAPPIPAGWVRIPHLCAH